jgi:chromosome segregation ATPase
MSVTISVLKDRIETNNHRRVFGSIEQLRQERSEHEARIHEIDDQIEKLDKENEALANGIWIIEQYYENFPAPLKALDD